jgi:hypothetical protein
MFDLRLKIKFLLLLVLGIGALGINLDGGTTKAVCGRCAPVFDGTVGVGWGCTQSSTSNCVATSTGCTQCASCSCGGGGDIVIVE